MITITEAILALRPKANFIVFGGTYEGIQWNDQHQTKPAKEEIESEILRMQSNIDANRYRSLRIAEYPSITDYLDGVVKGDQAQIDKYITDCLAVKAKYPKGAAQ